jgi:hypothetical protein
MSFPYKGSCLCGEICFEVKQFLPEAAHCHCIMCRKFHGAAYATYGSVDSDHFRWISGQKQLGEYTAENGTVRSFCKQCGSSLVFRSPKGAPGEVEISLATMDSNVPVMPDAHIFTNYALSWTSKDDTLPCFGEGRQAKH